MQHANIHTLDLSAMTESIIKQIHNAGYNIPGETIRSLFTAAFTGREISYELFKAANGRLHKLLITQSIPVDIKRTVLLDMLAKSRGFANHHSLKHACDGKWTSIEVIDFAGSDQPLSKFFIHKDEIKTFLDDRGITFGSFSYTGGKKEIRILLETGTHAYIGSALQKEVNAFVKAIGIPMYKNFLVFPIAYHQEDPRIAVELIKRYEMFFFPNWRKIPNSFEPIHAGEIVSVLYENIHMSAPDMIVIGNLACDMPWKTPIAVLDTMLNLDGSQDFEIEVIQALLDVPYRERRLIPKNHGVPMSYLIDLQNREEYLILNQIKGRSADEVIRRHRESIHIFRIESERSIYVEHIEKHSGKTIGEIIRNLLNKAVDSHYDKIKAGIKTQFDFDESVKRRSFELCGMTHKELIDRDDDMWHHDMRKTIQHVIEEVIEHFDCIQSAIKSIHS
ncbi:MAG: hypothetical protein PHV62_03350 [Sulfuricurvum sp.]|nr:hypothetical protein [Sulfuricurvum sp.]